MEHSSISQYAFVVYVVLASSITFGSSCPDGQYFFELTGGCADCFPSSYGEGGECLPCRRGTYQDEYGQTHCKRCLSGITTPCIHDYTPYIDCDQQFERKSITVCVPAECNTGKYYDATTDRCIECAAGYFQNQAGQVSCTACPKGHYQDMLGQTSCKLCARGFYSHIRGREWCPACWDGVVQPKEGAFGCIACKRGTYTTGWGEASCTTCPPGQTTKNERSGSKDDCEYFVDLQLST